MYYLRFCFLFFMIGWVFTFSEDDELENIKRHVRDNTLIFDVVSKNQKDNKNKDNQNKKEKLNLDEDYTSDEDYFIDDE